MNATEDARNDLILLLGPGLPRGSSFFNQDNFAELSTRAVIRHRVDDRQPQLFVELESGADLTIGWHDGAILSIPLLINISRDLHQSRSGHRKIYLLGGLGAHYHQVIFEIDGVEAEPQLRPSVQVGLGLWRSVTKKWALNLRSTYVRSFTTRQVAQFAGMTIRSRDRYGYGAIMLMVGLTRRL
jgi:hypothetical protein